MSLITCPECGRQISDKAVACPNCGCLVNAPVEEPEEEVAKCAECGAPLPAGATECPNCGCPADDDAPSESSEPINTPAAESAKPAYYIEPKKTNRRTKRNCCLAVIAVPFILFILLIILGLAVGLLQSESPEAKERAQRQYERWNGQDNARKLKYVESMEETRKLIGGTVWHYTKNTSDSDEEFGFWLKVEFRGDGTYTHYYAKPSDGAWTKDREGTFEIKEGRYSDSGRRYIGVEWVGGEPYGMPCNFTLFVNTYRVSCKSDMLDIYYRGRFKASKTYYGQMTYGDYKWD